MITICRCGSKNIHILEERVEIPRYQPHAPSLELYIINRLLRCFDCKDHYHQRILSWRERFYYIGDLYTEVLAA